MYGDIAETVVVVIAESRCPSSRLLVTTIHHILLQEILTVFDHNSVNITRLIRVGPICPRRINGEICLRAADKIPAIYVSIALVIGDRKASSRKVDPIVTGFPREF